MWWRVGLVWMVGDGNRVDHPLLDPRWYNLNWVVGLLIQFCEIGFYWQSQKCFDSLGWSRKVQLEDGTDLHEVNGGAPGVRSWTYTEERRFHHFPKFPTGLQRSGNYWDTGRLQIGIFSEVRKEQNEENKQKLGKFLGYGLGASNQILVGMGSIFINDCNSAFCSMGFCLYEKFGLSTEGTARGPHLEDTEFVTEGSYSQHFLGGWFPRDSQASVVMSSKDKSDKTKSKSKSKPEEAFYEKNTWTQIIMEARSLTLNFCFFYSW